MKRYLGRAFILCLALSIFALSMVLGAGNNLEALESVRFREPKSLKDVPVPEPVNLAKFVKNKTAAIALGKALFWEMQVGSDGRQACASCHFHAGADNRIKNNVSPGLLAGDTTFQVAGPNGTVKPADFPFRQFQVPDKPGFELNRDNKFVHNFNDAMSSQGVRHFQFLDIIRGASYERGTPIPDPVFHVGKKNTRRVEPRNSPSVINAVFNFSNFWDGRARNIFNGVNPFGELDEDAKVFVNGPAGLQATQVRIPDASLASQAVGPPLNDFEMTSLGRTFPKLAKKLFSLRPLGLQRVHPNDSVLGRYARRGEPAHPNDEAFEVEGDAELANGGYRGLNTTYVALIREAFHDEWWNSRDKVITFDLGPEFFHEADRDEPRSFFVNNGIPTILDMPNGALKNYQYTQMEANFSLFFGLAIQLYEATLVSDDTKFDRVMEKRARFTRDEEEGFDIFRNQGRCVACHDGPEFTNHSVGNVRNGQPAVGPGFVPNNFIEFMNIANRSNVIYDNGIYNISVTPGGSNIPGKPGFVPNNEDIGRGATAPIINPLTGDPYPLSVVRLAKLKAKNLLPPGVALFVPDLPPGVDPDVGVAVDGSQKTTGLRNVELTGPYFHNGSASTLQQVVEFYVRGGNFPVTNAFNLDPDIVPIGRLRGHPERQRQLVAFLKTLTDERVRNEMAPFDHPEIFVPNGHPGNEKRLHCGSSGYARLHTSYCDDFIKVPAVGAEGRPAQGLPPLGTFLNLPPEQS